LQQRDKVLVGSFVALLALACSVGLLSGPGTVAASSDAIERTDGVDHSRAPRLLTVPDRNSGLEALGPQSPAAGYTSAGAFLAAYWGEAWPAIREENNVGDQWLGRINLRELCAWENVGPQVGDSVMETLDVLDQSFLRDSLICRDSRGTVNLDHSVLQLELLGGASQDFDSVRAIARKNRALITEATRSYRNDLQREVRAYWNADRAVHHPIVMPMKERPKDAVFHLRSARQWWVFEITLTAGEYPGLAKKKDLIDALRTTCVDEIATELVRLREAAAPGTQD